MTASSQTPVNVTVELPIGRIAGQRQPVTLDGQAGEVLAFRTVPYAEPPLGWQRFAPPEPVRAWADVRDATRPGPIAPQGPSRWRAFMGDIEAPQSEDCLHLTIWTPACDGERRPVLVWFHGGDWQSGAGALDWYDGALLARRGDIVVVAVNYRLGALGWLFVPDEVVNPGLLDQECALRWIIDHIAAFGGDPGRMTAMGQSAGASSIAALLIRGAPLDRVILQSPLAADAFRPAALAAELSARILQACGVTSLGEARQLPVANLLLAQGDPRIIEVLRAEKANRSLFCPVVDGVHLPLDIEDAWRAAAGRADVLVGHALNELVADGDARRDVGLDSPGDRQFGAPARQWADSARRHGRDAWLYRFDFAPNSRFGACHSIELPFVFGTLAAFGDAPMLRGLDPRSATRHVTAVQDAWLDFIRRGAAGWPQAPASRSLP